MVMFYSYVKLPEGNVFILKAKVQRIVPPSFLPTLMHRKIDSLGLTAFFFSRFYWCCCLTKPFIHSDGFSRPRSVIPKNHGRTRSVKNSPAANGRCRGKGRWPRRTRPEAPALASHSHNNRVPALGWGLSSHPRVVLTGKTHRLWGSHILRQAKNINVYKYYISCDVTWCIHFFVYSGSFI